MINNIVNIRLGLWIGGAIFLAMILSPAPDNMTPSSWYVAALVVIMAIWWMTQAVPLTVTALLPFLALPLMDIMSASDVAAQYYSPILFLILGGAFIALAIERTGLHRRVALAIVSKTGESAMSLLLAFMAATAFLSMIISNTSTTLIMIPIVLAVLNAGGIGQSDKDDVKGDVKGGFAGALIMGIAFAASIGGLGTLVGSPTNAIAAGLINQQLGVDINFLVWAKYGLPIVIIGIPLCAIILAKVQKLSLHPFDVAAARQAIGQNGAWSAPEKRVMAIILLVMAGWIFSPYLKTIAPDGAITDGSIAIAGALLLFIIPDGDPNNKAQSRTLLNWTEANHAPWAVIMMFGGGLALAAGITQSGLANWLGGILEQFSDIHPLLIAIIIVGLIIIITEFASNVATATGIIPVVAALVIATGADPWTLAIPAAMAASWGFMLPSGTGPNALAWATGHISLPKMISAGLILDILGIPLIAGSAWIISSF